MATTKVPEQKVILCGEFGVGKSSIFRRFATNTFVSNSDRHSTLGLDHFDKVYRIHGKNVRVQLWDTGGMERVASITSSYYKFAEAAILVFSFDSPDSFNVLSQHLLDIVTYAEGAKIFLCGNKTDLLPQNGEEGCVTDADIENFCEQCHNLVSGIYKTSCKSGAGVDDMFTDIARQLIGAYRIKDMEQEVNDSFKISAQDEPSNSCAC